VPVAKQEFRKTVPSRSASAKNLAVAELPAETDTSPAPPAPQTASAPRALKESAPGNSAANDSAAGPAATPPDAAKAPPVPQRPIGGPPGRVMPPPRPMANAETFEEGDHVVYPTHGVGKVERIATEEIAGHKLELIHITFEENRMTLRVPVTKARTAGLRKLATRKMFDEAMVVLRGRPRIKRTMWSRRAQEYEAKINSGDPLAIAEVVRDLHRNSGQPDQSFSERQIYEAAMDRLAAELAALERIDKATASVKLADFLKTV
jgi:CarD family transcriptional regulator